METCRGCDDAPNEVHGDAHVRDVGDDLEVTIDYDCPNCGTSVKIVTSAPEITEWTV